VIACCGKLGLQREREGGVLALLAEALNNPIKWLEIISLLNLNKLVCGAYIAEHLQLTPNKNGALISAPNKWTNKLTNSSYY